MTQATMDTKQALLDAAGELFSEHGVDGASIRAIAERGGANIAAINYHFGSKENLYTEVLRHVLGQSECTRAQEAVTQGLAVEKPEVITAVIGDIIRERFSSYFAQDKPSWYGRLVMRSILDPSPSFEAVMKQFFIPEHEALRTILRRFRPSLSDEEAGLWAFSVMAPIAFYAFAEMPILMTLGMDTYSAEFLERAADHVTHTILAALGVPEPAE